MTVKVGDEAPLFEADSVNMGHVSLEEYRGRRVLLVFGRYFGCPVCQYDFDSLLEMHRGGLSAEVIYVTQSSPESAGAYIESLDVGFPVLPVEKRDGGYSIYYDYGVSRFSITSITALIRRSREARGSGKVHGPYEGSETQSPADFVINEIGKVIWAHLGVLEPEKLSSFLRGS